MTNDTTYIPAQRAISAGVFDIGGLDEEQKARLGFLARYTGNTRASYNDDLEVFRNWLSTSMQVHSLLLAERVHVQMYVRWLENRHLAPATIGRRMTVLRSFYKNCVIDDVIVKDPTLGVTTPKINHEEQRTTWLWPLEFAALLREAKKDPRYHLMVILLGEYGLRVGEMCALNIEDIHHEPGAVYISYIAKGRKPMRKNLTLGAIQAIDAYVGTRTSGPLFLSQEGTRWTTNSVRRIIKPLALRAGITRDITPHGLRRTTGTTMQMMGKDVTTIQQMLGHADPRTTMRSYAKGGQSVADIGFAELTAFMSGLGS